MKQWPDAATTLALAPRAAPRATHIFTRGDWKRPGVAVTPGTPAFLHPFRPDAPRNRLGLARWIVDQNNPLTSRVIVNRVWQQYFGQGLVATLTTLNDAVFMETARALALRVWREGGADDRARMIYAFRLCTGRKPGLDELQRLLALLQKQQARFRGQTAAAVQVAARDLNDLPPGVDPHRIAPWTMVARALLNLDETITRQ